MIGRILGLIGVLLHQNAYCRWICQLRGDLTPMGSWKVYLNCSCMGKNYKYSSGPNLCAELKKLLGET